jgi:nitrogen fixation NifU-like protein
LHGATHYGVEGSPGDGPYCQVWLIVTEGLIKEAAFKTPGCPASTAAASVMCHLVTNRTLEHASLLTGEDLLRIIGGLPEGKEGHAFRSIEALEAALTPQGTGQKSNG